jgi:branched-chain amino acid transport system substrate-binding protein
MRPIRTFGAALAVTALFLTGCTTSDASDDEGPKTVSGGGDAATEDETYTLGLALPLTGSAASYGEEYRKVVEMGIEAANAQYAADGITLEVEVQDTQATAEGGVSAMNKLGAVSEAPAVLTAWSAVVAAGIPVAEDLGFALFNAGAQSPTLIGSSPNLVNVLPMNDSQLAGFTEYLTKDLGMKTFASIYVDNESGQGTADAFKAAIEERGGEMVAEESIRQDATDASTQVAKVEQADPDFVYVQTLLVEGASVFKAIRETEPDATFGSYAGVGESRVIRDAGREAYNGLYYMSHIPEDIDAVQGLLDEIKAVNPSRTLVNQSYDSYFYATPFVYAEAIKRLREQGAPVTGSNVLAVLREATDIEVPIVGVMDLTKGLTYSSATVIRRANDYKADPMTDETVTTVSTD